MSAASDRRDKVRLLIGDTDEADPLLSDDEIDTFTDDWPNNPELAAANAAHSIAAGWARGFNFTTDGQTFNRSERVGHYLQLADELRCRGEQYSIPLLSTGGTTVWNLGTLT